MVGALKLSVWSLNHYKILVCISRLFFLFIFLAIALLIVISIRIKFLQRHQHPIHHPKVLTINWRYIREFNPLSTSPPLHLSLQPLSLTEATLHGLILELISMICSPKKHIKLDPFTLWELAIYHLNFTIREILHMQQ